MTTYLLSCEASLHIIPGETERLRALQHVCAALPRTAQALSEQVRPLGPRQLACMLSTSAR